MTWPAARWSKPAKITLLVCMVWSSLFPVVFFAGVVIGEAAGLTGTWLVVAVVVVCVLTALLAIAEIAFVLTDVSRNELVRERDRPLWMAVVLAGFAIPDVIYWWRFVRPDLTAEGNDLGRVGGEKPAANG